VNTAVLDLARERRIRSIVGDLRSLLDSDPPLAARTAALLAGELTCPALEDPMPNDRAINLRLPGALLDRVAELVPVLQQHPLLAATRVTQSVVIRLALDQGLERLEKDFGGGRPLSYTHMVDGKQPVEIKPPPMRAQIDSGEAARKARKQTAAPDDTDPASAYLRQYRKPSRMVKPSTATAAHLRKWRQGEGLSQAKAAELLGIGQSSYSALETGKRRPVPPLDAKLAELAGIDPGDWTADGEA
jgi:DNA-binding XRE family transcriptional regulator